jgi:hypothetical protein
MPDKMNRKPPWRARRLARRMANPRLFSHRAAAADQQIRDLSRALRMPASAIPSSPGAAGRRMRLGPESRALLKRVRSSRTLKEAQAWMKELAHQIRQRTRIHDRRRRVAQRIRNRGRKARQWTGRHARRGWQAARPHLANAGRGVRDASRRWQEPMLKRAERRHAARQQAPQGVPVPRPARNSAIPHYRPPRTARVPRPRRAPRRRPARVR